MHDKKGKHSISGDGSHPSASGSYLTACTMLETIYGVSCVGNTYKPVANAAELQQVCVADRVILSRILDH